MLFIELSPGCTRPKSRQSRSKGGSVDWDLVGEVVEVGVLADGSRMVRIW